MNIFRQDCCFSSITLKTKPDKEQGHVLVVVFIQQFVHNHLKIKHLASPLIYYLS